MTTLFKGIDIADFYISLANSLPDNSIDNLKLNKLLYFAQGWHMVKLHKPLFMDEIEAWDYGPVIPAVYHAFKCCGANPIEEPLDKFDEKRLSEDTLSLLLDVYNEYGRYTGWALKDLTHQPDTPWSKVYERGMNRRISQEDIEAYFKTQKLDEFDVHSLNIPVVTQIPDEWDSDEDEVYD